jgi:chromosome segregation ATPase
MAQTNEIENLRKEVNDLKKNKIILQAKLKQKEDKITDLTNKLRQLSISAKEAGPSKDLENKITDLENELKRSRKVNKDLRSESSSLENQLADAKKALAAKPAVQETPTLEKVNLPGAETPQAAASSADTEELEYLRTQVSRKDNIIAKLSGQLESMSPEQLGQGSSFMKTRQLNAKIRELKSSLELAKKSEAEMRVQMMDMNRKMALKDEDMSW